MGDYSSSARQMSLIAASGGLMKSFISWYRKTMKLIQILFICWAAIFLTACDSGGGISKPTLVSPDQAYTAVLITEVGGGISGSSCIDTVAVIPGKAILTTDVTKKSKAYVGGCHSLKMTTVNGQAVIPNGPQVSWAAPHELHIVFNPQLAQQGVSEVYSATSLYDGAVTIRNEFQ
jgi:hypothetical protein